jgi:multiple sugar transport system permease protein
MTKADRRNLRNGLLFCSPWLIGFSVFVLYPIAASVYYSFCEYSVLEPSQWIGLGNYADLLQDDVFWKAVGNTAYYAVLALPLGMFLALTLALLLNTGVRGMAVYRTIFFLPSLVPMIALGVLWLWIFHGTYGILNELLRPITRLVHLEPPVWLDSVRWSKPALIIAGLWTVGQPMIIYLAGLQDVPTELYEAAEIDGANWFHKIWHVTLPMISPVILFNLLMGIIWTLQIFAVPFVMMRDGRPARSAYFFAMYLYDSAFRYLQMGYASALAWILFLTILALTLLALRLTAKHVHYGGTEGR